MRVLILSLVILLDFVIRTTLLNAIGIFGIKPDTTIIIIVCYAVLRGDIEGCILGFFAGILYDVFFGRYFGFFALTGALTGYFCGKPFRDFFKENYLIPIILTFVSALCGNIAFYIVHILLQARTDFFRYIYMTIMPAAIYTALFAAPIYWFVMMVNGKLEKYERSRW